MTERYTDGAPTRLAAALVCSLWAALAGAGDALPRLHSVSCWFTPPAGRVADCARLHVVQSRGRDDGGEVVLPLVIYRSSAAARRPDPVVVMGGGGPGNPAGIDAESANDWWEFLDVLALDGGRDVVVVDQRGAGLAEPSMVCDWSEQDAGQDLAGAVPLVRHLRRIERVVKRCRTELLAAGVDLAAYDAAAAAEDFEDLRRALGVERWNLYATSYAARIALTLLRVHAAGVRSAIIDSPVTPEARFYEESSGVIERAFEAVFAACEADAACAGLYPDSSAAFARVVQRLQRKPLSLTVAWPDTLGPFVMHVNGERLIEILSQALYDSARTARVPLVVQALDRGSSDLLAPFARDLVKQYVAGGWSDGLYYSVMCREELPFNDIDAALRQAGRSRLFADFNSRWLESERAACRVWQVAPAEPAVESPVSADTPALVLAGALDPVVPAAWGRRAAAALPNSYFQEFPAVGHDVIGSSDCALTMAASFLADPRRDPRDAVCLQSPARIYFDLDY